MRVGLYHGSKWDSIYNKFDESKAEVLVEVDNLNFSDRLLKINNKIYTLESLSRQNNFATVKETVIHTDSRELSLEDNVACPYCSHKDLDSWEHKYDEDDIECCQCGGKFSYIRHITVEYDSIPIEAPKVKEIP